MPTPSPKALSRRTLARRRNVGKRAGTRLNFALELERIIDRAPDDESRFVIKREITRLRRPIESRIKENQRRLLFEIKRWGEVTTTELATETGLPRDVVSETISVMLASHEPKIKGYDRGNSGRRGITMVWSLV